MGLFNKLNLDKVFDSVSSGVDKLAFTQEERADFNMKISDKVSEFVGSSLSENTERSKARRTIAYIVVANFFALIWAVIILYFFNENAATFVKGMAVEWQVPTAFIMVLAFFFSAYLLRGTPLKKKD
ncbi:hypothetical protein [Carboxylicivirga linearis]|uniref:Holin-X, holin superfamily III n=1 Tax=Carboxylicivirga linearis TaxID=1628157 RepID=A0ABS5K0Y6_9BACT|nr:hypothetical protein [Carboxylicivirga linearis]MBS2100715.1 hypothetical protein [Carboxylicivirga linearis]